MSFEDIMLNEISRLRWASNAASTYMTTYLKSQRSQIIETESRRVAARGRRESGMRIV
jgi:hypothetical protein